MKTQLLCVGDMHLGRRPSGLPIERLSEWGLTPAHLSPRAAWELICSEAIRRNVDAVLLAGDVVETDNSFFEAYGPLAEGAQRLAQAKIPLIAVAGNHDVQVLPRLASEISDVHLLGAGGRWASIDVAGRDGPSVRVLGWSFPEQHVRASPLPVAGVSIERERFTLGLLHCDLDVRTSAYAPVARAALESETGVNAWMLGHIHKPSLDARATRPIGYLGSVVGLDPSETGVHGPWLLSIQSQQRFDLEQLPLAPLRWERRALDVEGIASVEALDSALMRALEELRASLEREDALPRAAGLRVALEGSSTLADALHRRVAELNGEGVAPVDRAGLLCFIESIDDRIRPRVDLASRARGSDPAGLLARKLLALEDPRSAECAELLRGARSALEAEQRRSVSWAVLEQPDLSDEPLRARLVRAGWKALERLEETREESRR